MRMMELQRFIVENPNLEVTGYAICEWDLALKYVRNTTILKYSDVTLFGVTYFHS